MTDSEPEALVQRLRALRVAPPANDFEASLLRRLSAPEMASNVRVGPWAKRRGAAVPAAAAVLLMATSAAALIGHFAAPALQQEQPPGRESRAPVGAKRVQHARHAWARPAPTPVQVEPAQVEPVQSSHHPDPIEPSMPQERARPRAPRRSAVHPAERPGEALLSQELRALSSERVDLRAPSASELSAPQRSQPARGGTRPSEFERAELGKGKLELRSERTHAREIRREPDGTRHGSRVVRDASHERGIERERERAREADRAERERERGRDRERDKDREGERGRDRGGERDNR